jgi:hypothetical protein
MSGSKIEDIARKLNPIIRGWLNYFTAYCKCGVDYTMKCINKRLCIWAKRMYKHLKKHTKMAWKYIRSVAASNSTLFVHWKMGWLP